jgi:hypothetical protein
MSVCWRTKVKRSGVFICALTHRPVWTEADIRRKDGYRPTEAGDSGKGIRGMDSMQDVALFKLQVPTHRSLA